MIIVIENVFSSPWPVSSEYMIDGAGIIRPAETAKFRMNNLSEAHVPRLHQNIRELVAAFEQTAYARFETIEVVSMSMKEKGTLLKRAIGSKRDTTQKFHELLLQFVGTYGLLGVLGPKLVKNKIEASEVRGFVATRQGRISRSKINSAQAIVRFGNWDAHIDRVVSPNFEFMNEEVTKLFQHYLPDFVREGQAWVPLGRSTDANSDLHIDWLMIWKAYGEGIWEYMSTLQYISTAAERLDCCRNELRRMDRNKNKTGRDGLGMVVTPSEHERTEVIRISAYEEQKELIRINPDIELGPVRQAEPRTMREIQQNQMTLYLSILSRPLSEVAVQCRIDESSFKTDIRLSAKSFGENLKLSYLSEIVDDQVTKCLCVGCDNAPSFSENKKRWLLYCSPACRSLQNKRRYRERKRQKEWRGKMHRTLRTSDALS